MSSPRTRRRWFDVLRRESSAETSVAATIDEPELWSTRDRADAALVYAVGQSERLVAASRKQQNRIEAAGERVQGFEPHLRAIEADLKALGAAVERVHVVALNAGLEGARGPEGRALSLVSEDLRAQVQLGIETLQGFSERIGELRQKSDETAREIARCREEGAEIVAFAEATKGHAEDARRDVSRLEALLCKVTGLDPHSAKKLQEAGEHARALAETLRSLDAKAAIEASRRLAPVLAPFLRLFGATSAPPSEPPKAGP